MVLNHIKNNVFQVIKIDNYLEETHDGDLVVFDEFLGGLNAVEGDGWGTSLLLDPSNDGLGGSAAVVFAGLSVSKENNSGLFFSYNEVLVKKLSF